MTHVEQLETRRLMAAFTAASVAELISDMNAANAAGGFNRITLAPGTTFKLNSVDNMSDGPNGLPSIAAGNDLTILGNGDIIERNTAPGTPEFRLLDVRFGGSLALNNLTVQGGLVRQGPAGNFVEGGGIYSQGTLSLNAVTIQNCIAQGDAGALALGGGIRASGVLSVANSAVLNNQALGGSGYLSAFLGFYPGSAALGGGLYFGTGTATLTNSTFSSNLARGGDGGIGYTIHGKGGIDIQGGAGGDGDGGGIFVGGGTLTLQGTVITGNSAKGGPGGSSARNKLQLPRGADGVGRGGGLYIASSASVSLDSFTVAHTSGNTASTSNNDIFGSFTILG